MPVSMYQCVDCPLWDWFICWLYYPSMQIHDILVYMAWTFYILSPLHVQYLYKSFDRFLSIMLMVVPTQWGPSYSNNFPFSFHSTVFRFHFCGSQVGLDEDVSPSCIYSSLFQFSVCWYSKLRDWDLFFPLYIQRCHIFMSHFAFCMVIW